MYPGMESDFLKTFRKVSFVAMWAIFVATFGEHIWQQVCYSMIPGVWNIFGSWGSTENLTIHLTGWLRTFSMAVMILLTTGFLIKGTPASVLALLAVSAEAAMSPFQLKYFGILNWNDLSGFSWYSYEYTVFAWLVVIVSTVTAFVLLAKHLERNRFPAPLEGGVVE